METVRCCEHPARVNEAATAQEVVHAPYVLEDASYPRLRLNLRLPSTNNLEVLADAPLTTHRPCEKKKFCSDVLTNKFQSCAIKNKIKKPNPSCVETNITYHTSLCCKGFLEWHIPFWCNTRVCSFHLGF